MNVVILSWRVRWCGPLAGRRRWLHASAITLAAVLLSASLVAAQTDPIYDGYARFYGGDNAAAQSHFDALRAANQQDVRAWFGSLFVLQARISDDDTLQPAFERAIDTFLTHVDGRYTRSKGDAEALFHLAQGHLLRSMYRINHDKGMWGAARDAAKSKGYADEYIKRHPEHGDAYLVLGLYNYFVDIAPNFVKVMRILLFLPSGNRTEGLKQLERASRDGSLFAPLAETILADIYGSLEGRLVDALPIGERLVKRFPANAGMRFSLAEIYMHPSVEAYDAAAQQYAAILERATTATPAHVSARYNATLALANLRRTQWRLDEAITLLSPTIEQNVQKPDWVVPTFLLRRGNYRMLLNEAVAVDDARRVQRDAKMAKWHKAAAQQLSAIGERTRSNEAAIYTALIPGNRLLVLDRFDEAKAIYQGVAASAPSDWQPRYRLAYLEFARGNYSQASAALSAIVTTTERMPSWLKAAAMLTLGWTHDIAGRRAEALRLYKRIVDDFENETAAGSARLGLIAPYRGPIKTSS